MKKLIRVLLLSLFTLPVMAETVYLTSLDWPPYAGKNLTEQGASVAVAKAAFKAMGHELEVDFFPWSRAVKLASEGSSKYVGYFPEYLYDSEEFVFSAPMGQGPLGLVERSDKAISWSALQDLSNYSIGVVQDYVNTEELDAMIAAGTIKAQVAPSDELNIQKVAGSRIDAAVIDANVMKYLLANSAKLEKAIGQVQMNSKLLTNKDLFVAFKNSADGKKWKAIYDEGLGKIDVATIMAKYMQ
jgi:polar amino acid transport system substrate-binding protein